MDCIEKVIPTHRNEPDLQSPTILNSVQVKAILNAIRTLGLIKRRKRVLNAFDVVILNLRENTGEVMLTRDQLAQEIGCYPGNVSSIMTELVRFGVVTRGRKRIKDVNGPGITIYFVNPHVAWKGSFTAFKAKIAESKPPFSPSL